jgi:hypothetical protein
MNYIEIIKIQQNKKQRYETYSQITQQPNAGLDLHGILFYSSICKNFRRY